MLDLSVTGGQDGYWTETLGDKDTQAGVTLLKNKRDFSILKYTKKNDKDPHSNRQADISAKTIRARE